MMNVKTMSMEQLYLEREAHDILQAAIRDEMEKIVKENGISKPLPKKYYAYRDALSDLQRRCTEITVEIGERKTA